jgi:hypothetical protein
MFLMILPDGVLRSTPLSVVCVVMGDFKMAIQCHIGTNSKPKKSGAEVGAAAGAAAAAAPPRGFRFAARGAAEAAAAAAGAAAARPPLRGRSRAGAGAGAAAGTARLPRELGRGGIAKVAVWPQWWQRTRITRFFAAGRRLSARCDTVQFLPGASAEQQRAHIRCSAEEGSSTPSRAATARTSRISTRASAGSSDACAERQRYESRDTAPDWAAVGCIEAGSLQNFCKFSTGRGPGYGAHDLSRRDSSLTEFRIVTES